MSTAQDNPLCFKQITTVRGVGGAQVACSSIAVSHKYGVVALSLAGQLHLVHIDHILAGGHGDSKQIGDIFKTKVPSNVLASTEDILAIGVQDTVFLIPYPELLKDMPRPLTTIKVKAQVTQIAFNPTDGTMVAILSSDGNLRLCKIGPQGTQNFVCNDTQIKCICFSPKGKQLCAGHQSGEFSQLKLDLTLAKKFTGPGAVPVSLLWVSTTQFLALFREGEDICLAQIDLPKGSPPVINSLGDVFISDVVNDQSHSFFSYLNLETIICSSTTSSEFVALTKAPTAPSWTVADIDDQRRAALPIDNFSVGGVLYYNYPAGVAYNESEVYGAMPVYLAASQFGVLAAFSVVNKAGLGEGAKLTRSEQLNWPSTVTQPQQQQPQQQQLQQPVAQPVVQPPQVSFTPPTPAFTTQPLQFGTPSSFATQPVPFGIPSSVTTSSFGTPISSPATIPFGTTQIQSPQVTPITQAQPQLQTQPQSTNIQQQQFFAPPEVKPQEVPQLTTNIRPDQQRQPEVVPTASHSETQRDPDTTRLRKQSKAGAPLTEAEIEKVKAQIRPTDTCSEALLRQFDDLQLRVSNFRQLKSSFDKDYQNRLSTLANDVDKETLKIVKMEDFTDKMEKTCKVQSTEVNLLKDKSLTHFSQVYYAKSLEERNRDPRYLQLLRSQPMDTATLKNMRDIENMAGYVRQQIQECRRHNYFSKCPPLSPNETYQYIQKTLATHAVLIKRLSCEHEKLKQMFTPTTLDKELEEVTTGLLKTTIFDNDACTIKKDMYEALKDFSRTKTVIKLKSGKGKSSQTPLYYFSSEEDRLDSLSSKKPVTSAELLKELRSDSLASSGLGDRRYSGQVEDGSKNREESIPTTSDSGDTSPNEEPGSRVAGPAESVEKKDQSRPQSTELFQTGTSSIKFDEVPRTTTTTPTLGFGSPGLKFDLPIGVSKTEPTVSKPTVKPTQPFAFSALTTPDWSSISTTGVGFGVQKSTTTHSSINPQPSTTTTGNASIFGLPPQNLQIQKTGEVQPTTTTSKTIFGQQSSNTQVSFGTTALFAQQVPSTQAESSLSSPSSQEFTTMVPNPTAALLSRLGQSVTVTPVPPKPAGSSIFSPQLTTTSLLPTPTTTPEKAPPNTSSLLFNYSVDALSAAKTTAPLFSFASLTTTSASTASATASPIGLIPQPVKTSTPLPLLETPISVITASEPGISPISPAPSPPPTPAVALTDPNENWDAELQSSGAESAAVTGTTPTSVTTAVTTAAVTDTPPVSPATATSILGQSGVATTTTATALGQSQSTSSIFGVSSPVTATASSPSIFGQPVTASNTSVFGQLTTPASATSIFGQPTSASSPSTTSIFGQPPATTAVSGTTSIFGDPATSTPGGTSIFGQPATGTTQSPSQTSIFGQPATGATQSPPQTSIFGQSATATAQSPSQTSIFGQPPKTPATTASIFGQPATPAVFGQPVVAGTGAFGGAFGQPVSTTPSIFGQQTQSPSSIFGGGGAVSTSTGSSPSVFGQNQTGLTSVFGQSTQSIFGQSATSPTASVFGGQAASGTTPTASVFGGQGASATSPTASVFGGQAASATSPKSIFGQSTSSPSVFGQSSPSVFGQQSPSVFGQSAATTQSTTSPFGSTFGSNTSSFGKTPGSIFGGGSAFGSAAASPTTGVFGASSSQSPTSTDSLFGGSAFSGLGSVTALKGSTAGGIFAGGSTFGQSSSTSSSIFGQPSSLFGGSTTQQRPGVFGAAVSTAPSSSFGSLGASSPTTATPVFGGPPVFGSPAPAFGTASFGSGATATAFGGGGSSTFGSGSSGGSIFGGAAVQQGTIGFGQLAQQGGVAATPFQNTGFGFGSQQQPQQQQPQQQQQQPSSFGGNSFSSWR